MPKKTKKEKIIATYHKKLQLLEQRVGVEKKEISKKMYTYAIDSTDDPKAISYFFSDLKKSIILITTIILLEIGFYYATINNYFGLGI